MQFRQSLLKYAEKHGVTKAAIKYNVNRQYVYRWKRRYTGDIQSLANRSHRPHHHPNQHTEAELHKITSFRRRNPNIGLVVLWVKLRKSGYKRSITGLYRVLRRQGQMPEKLPNPKYIPKPYEQMHFPGERVQIDVKFVPEVCIVGDAKGEKFYQYTAIDEFSRWRYLEAFQEHSSYSSAIFLEHLVKAAPFKIRCIQTDNGTEFTRSSFQTRPTLICSSRNWKNSVSGTSSLSHLRHGIMERWNAPIAKITNTSMLRINFIRFMISKSSLLFTVENTITFPFALWAGSIL